MTNLASLLANAFDFPFPAKANQIKLNGERCIITGEKLTVGYRVLDVLSKATNDFEMFFDAHHSYMSVDAARCFQGSNPKAKPRARMEASKSLVIVGGVGYEPLISDKAAKEQDRHWWAQLVRDVWEKNQGNECLFILSTDTKTRIWHHPHVRVGVLGATTPVTLYDPSQAINRTYVVNWPEMLEDLDTVERIVSAGYWNKYLGRSLFEFRKKLGVPLAQVAEWETQLQILRQKPHFKIIQLIAREREEYRWQPQQQKSLFRKQPQLALF